MTVSFFDLFSIGIGPSSSHTVGPMRAAKMFVEGLRAPVDRLQVILYGSLAHTGKGHGTDLAVLNGLEGCDPASAEPAHLFARRDEILSGKSLCVLGQYDIVFSAEDLCFEKKELLPMHPNGMRFIGYCEGKQVACRDYYSIGGGFVLDSDAPLPESVDVPYPFESAAELLALCHSKQLSIADVMRVNESAWHPGEDIDEKVLYIADLMESIIEKGCRTEGKLPGGLQVQRRAKALYEKLERRGLPNPCEQTDMMNWLNVYAMAVNEENAAGGRIVTAPTNGAAGIIPAVLTYYRHYHRGVTPKHCVDFLLTAGAIGILYKKNASISGAEVGCQGEVGVASSMAAGALAAVLGGSLVQIENAAEIAMEHHLGMTCDPIAGLVQIPCIERNAMGAVKAVNAARLSLLEDRENFVRLDKIISTMMATGRDMSHMYKETSLGGLAVNVVEC